MIETRVSPSSATTANSKKWDSKPLGEVCEIKGGGTPSTQVQSYWQGDLPWVSPKDMKSETITDSIDHISNEAIVCSATNLVIKESILMVVRSGILARTVPIAIAGRDLAINQDIKAFTPKPYLNSRFLYLFLESQMDRLLALVSKGATVHRLNVDQLKTLRVPLPSLQEQDRIVAILDETFEGIAKTRANANRVLTVSIALFESRVAQVFSARGDGWKQQRLDDVCSDITVGHVGSMIKEYRDDGVPFLRSQNIRPFRISLENVVYIDAAFNATLKKSQLRPGDLAIVRTGYPGTAAVIPSDLPISNCSDLVIVRPGPALDPFYMAHFFNSAHGKRLVLGNLVGSAQKHFNIGSAKSVSVPVPSLKQQQQVVSMLDEFRAEVQRLEAVHLQKLESLEALKQSILQQAFSGTL